MNYNEGVNMNLSVDIASVDVLMMMVESAVGNSQRLLIFVGFYC